MWKHLLELHRESKLNAGEPVYLFAETLLFNEGWLLRSVLKEWKTSSRRSEFPFFRFPSNAKVYSEGQLRTPFKVRPKSERIGESKGETNTRVDGIVGDFSIADGTKSGIKLHQGCEYVAVFEAKLYSPIGKGTKNAPDYDQLSRTTACLIHALLKADLAANCNAHLVVLYPKDNLEISEDDYPKAYIKAQIRKRLAGYMNAGDSIDEIVQFEAGWEEMFERLQGYFVTWEEVLDEIGDESLMRFYKLCKKFNCKKGVRR